MNSTFDYGIDKLTVAKVIAITSGKLKGILNADAVLKISRSQEHVQKIIAENKTVYGVNTGFGILSNTKISKEDTSTQIGRAHV